MCHNPREFAGAAALSTEISEAWQAPLELFRGQVPFDSDTLRQAVNRLDHLAPLDDTLLAQYQQFYGFDVLLQDVRHKVSLLETNGHRIVVHGFTPELCRGYVLLCHGYYDHIGLYGHVIRYLTSRGLSVITFDQIGHGLSSGAPATIDSFDQYVAVTSEVYQQARDALAVPEDTAFHWVGQSMGGAIVMELLHRYPQIKPAQVILFAPLVRPYAWWFAQWVYAVAKRTVESRPRRITTNASNVEFIRLQHADPLQADILPVQWVSAMVHWYHQFEGYEPSQLSPLIIQGERDKTIDWQFGRKLLRKRFSQSRWLMLPEASHHLVNESDALRSKIWHWLDEQCTWSAITRE